MAMNQTSTVVKYGRWWNEECNCFASKYITRAIKYTVVKY